jgi:hypothetical protein
MKQQMEAELLFKDPNGRDLAIAELTKRGFEVELLDAVDEWEGVVLSPTVWIKVRGASELDEHGFFNEMAQLAEQFNGDVGEAGLADPLPPVA